jgi:hypothetical protein
MNRDGIWRISFVSLLTFHSFQKFSRRPIRLMELMLLELIAICLERNLMILLTGRNIIMLI